MEIFGLSPFHPTGFNKPIADKKPAMVPNFVCFQGSPALGNFYICTDAASWGTMCFFLGGTWGKGHGVWKRCVDFLNLECVWLFVVVFFSFLLLLLLLLLFHGIHHLLDHHSR